MANILLDAIPCEFKGKRFNSDYKAVLSFFRAVQSDKADTEKAQLIGQIFFDGDVPDDEGLFAFLKDFITMGEDEPTGQRVFDFEVDSGRIYASFVQAYGIDLTETAMHWWKFMELFKALPDDTIIKKVIDIRTRKPNKNDSKESRAALAAAKARYQLDTPTLSALFGE